MRTSAILALIIFAGYWLDSERRRRKHLDRATSREAIEDWEGEGGNIVEPNATPAV